MPSASSHRYQSRLFNFVDQHSRRFSDRLQQTFRQLKVATSWSLEALLYPVYLLFQKAIDSAGRQLSPQQPQNQRSLQAHNTDSQLQSTPAADIPIQQVLKALEKLQLPLPNPKQTPTPQLPNNPLVSYSPLSLKESPSSPLPYKIRGIASELTSRNLVLVSEENEILNILTLQQQEKLQDRILTEISHYWRHWRLTALTAEKEETKLLTEIDHLLTKLTSGGNKNMPALPENTKLEERIEPISSLNAYPSLALLDAAVANLESNALVPMSRVTSLIQQRAAELMHVVPTQLNLFVYGKEQITTSEPKSVTHPDWENQLLKIQALIWAGINFFFGSNANGHVNRDDSGKKVKQATSARNILEKRAVFALSNSQELQSQELADPWLSENDLFCDSVPVSERENYQQLVTSFQAINPALVDSRSRKSSLKNLIKNFPKFFQQSKQDAALTLKTTPTQELTPTIGVAQSLITQSEIESNTGKMSQQQRYWDSQIEAKPDWVETKAKIIGYEKHPLEQILEWLDQVMLKLEERFVKFFRYLVRLWQRR